MIIAIAKHVGALTKTSNPHVIATANTIVNFLCFANNLYMSRPLYGKLKLEYKSIYILKVKSKLVNCGYVRIKLIQNQKSRNM